MADPLRIGFTLAAAFLILVAVRRATKWAYARRRLDDDHATRLLGLGWTILIGLTAIAVGLAWQASALVFLASLAWYSVRYSAFRRSWPNPPWL